VVPPVIGPDIEKTFQFHKGIFWSDEGTYRSVGQQINFSNLTGAPNIRRGKGWRCLEEKGVNRSCSRRRSAKGRGP